MTVWLEIGGEMRTVELPGSGAFATEMKCLVDGRQFRVNAQMLATGIMSLVLGEEPEATAGSPVDGRQFRCVLEVSPEGSEVIVDGQRVAFAVDDPRSLHGRRGAGAGADGPRAVKSPMPGRVVRVLVQVGDEVAAQQGLVVIEAMKMQNELKSPKAGRVARVSVGVGDAVQSGDVLVVVE